MATNSDHVILAGAIEGVGKGKEKLVKSLDWERLIETARNTTPLEERHMDSYQQLRDIVNEQTIIKRIIDKFKKWWNDEVGKVVDQVRLAPIGTERNKARKICKRIISKSKRDC